jgi:hypothetical protein
MHHFRNQNSIRLALIVRHQHVQPKSLIRT